MNHSLEAIAFQRDDILGTLSKLIGAFREPARKGIHAGTPNWPQTKAIEAFVFKRFGINFVYDWESSSWEDANAHVFMALGIGLGVFTPEAFDSWQAALTKHNVDFAGEYRKAEPGKSLWLGQVDLDKARLGGVFSKIPVRFGFNPKFFDKCGADDDECAAVLLHEIGHLFTQAELLTRTLRCNEIMGAVMDAHTQDAKGGGHQLIKTVLAQTASELQMTSKDVDMLTTSDDKTITMAAIINGYNRGLSSSLGFGKYGGINCEALADNFAVRCGAGKQLFTAMDKLQIELRGGRDSILQKAQKEKYTLIAACVLGVGGVIMAFTPFGALAAGLFYAGIVTAVVSSAFTQINQLEQIGYTYDSDKVRMTRMRNEMIALLKQVDSKDKAGVQSAVKALDEMEKILSDYPDAIRGFWGTLRLLSSEIRREEQFLDLHTKLEAMAHNDTFVKAARLRSLL